MTQEDDIPVLVVGCGLGVLGAIRLLGQAGLQAYCFGKPLIEAHSRWYRRAPGSDDTNSRPEDLAAYLQNCPLPCAVLIPASDAAVRAIADLPREYQQRFPSAVPTRRVVDQLCDKAMFAEMLEQVQVPGPRTTRIDGLEDFDKLEDREFEGAFLKPVDSAEFLRRFGVKGIRVANREDAIAKARDPLAEGHRLVVQDYIPSTTSANGMGLKGDHILIDAYVDHRGDVKTAFARRRLRMFPLDFGNSSYMVSIANDEVRKAADDLQKIATHIGYRGILSGEFKKDPRDGEYKLLEINSRVWWFVEFAGRCGVDLCKMSYLDALGRPVEQQTSYDVGSRMIDGYYDFHAIRALRREKKIGLLDAVRSWVGAQQPYFNWTDPLPAFYELKGRLNFANRRIGKLLATK